MKTSISNILRILPVFILLMISAKGYSQKSVDYPSVGRNLEDITVFIENSCQPINEFSTGLTNEFDTRVKYKPTGEFIDKISDWSEINLKELHEAAREVKVWLSKQYFAPVKRSANVNKEVAQKPEE